MKGDGKIGAPPHPASGQARIKKRGWKIEGWGGKIGNIQHSTFNSQRRRIAIL
jgi:hypothetical protein